MIVEALDLAKREIGRPDLQKPDWVSQPQRLVELQLEKNVRPNQGWWMCNVTERASALAYYAQVITVVHDNNCM